jgi:hypothetical protein
MVRVPAGLPSGTLSLPKKSSVTSLFWLRSRPRNALYGRGLATVAIPDTSIPNGTFAISVSTNRCRSSPAVRCMLYDSRNAYAGAVTAS